MTKETAPDEEVIMTPVIPEGEKYVAEPNAIKNGTYKNKFFH